MLHHLCRPESLAATSRRPARWCRPIAALTPLLLSAAFAAAQAPATGDIRGTLLDPRQHPIPAVQLRAQQQDGPAAAVTTTAPDGSFLIPAIEPGSYTLLLPSSALPSEPFDVPPGQTIELRLTLTSAGTLQLQPTTAPTPATSPALPDQDGDGLTTTGGLEPTQNVTLLDGVSATQTFAAAPVGTSPYSPGNPDEDSDAADHITGPSSGMARGRHAGVAYVFSQSAVREFRISGRSYSAQAGHGGEVATTVTRSGSAQLHGSVFLNLRSQLLAASDPLAIATTYTNGIVSAAEVKPHDLRVNFGFALGGPVPRTAKLVYFYSFDTQRRGFPAISSPANPAFYSLTAMQVALLGNRGVTPSQTSTALNYLASLTGSTPRRADQTLQFGRLDWHIRPRLTASAEYNRVRWTSPAGLMDAPVVARGRASIGNAAGSLDLLLLRLTTTVTPRLLNTIRIAYVGDLQYERPQSPLPQEPAISPGGLAPEVNISPDGLLFGTPAALSQIAYPDEQRAEFADTLTLVRGHHLLAAGGQVSLVHDTVASLANQAGTFSYDSGVTGGKAGGLVDFITDYTFNAGQLPSGGCPSIYATAHLFCFRSFSQSFGQTSAAFSTSDWAGFAEDTWRVRNGLTLQAGLRYEYTLLPVPTNPNPSLDAVFGSRAATSVFPEDRNNLGPRISAAYAPFGSGRGVLRLGYGVFFGRLPGATIQSALTDTAQTSSTSRVRIRPATVVACPQAPTSGFGYPCAFQAAPAGVVAATTSAIEFDRRYRLPMIQQGSLSIEQDVARDTRLTATYVFNLDRQLPGSRDINIAPPTSTAIFQLQGGTGAAGVISGETFVVPLYTARVSPSFGPVTDVVSDVNATYHGLTLAADSRVQQSLTLRADWTWSKAIDFGQNQSATPRTNGQFDPFTNGYDKALSSLNYPWAVRVVATWLPHISSHPSSQLSSHREWLQHAANGWAFTPIITARSGRPYSLDISGGTYLPGGHESINGSGGALYLPTIGRNTLRLPATATVNLRAEREFRPGSRLRLRAMVEALNLLNHQSVTSVNQRAFLVGTAAAGVTPLIFQSAAAIATEGLNTTPFATPTATGTSLVRARQLQLSLRAEF